MNAQSIIDKLKAADFYKDQIAHLEVIRPRQAKYGNPAKPLAPVLQRGAQFVPALSQRGGEGYHSRAFGNAPGKGSVIKLVVGGSGKGPLEVVGQRET